MSEIKRLRTASILKELIPEALSTLNDLSLKGLCVSDVECRKGRYDAFVYIDKSMLDEEEQKEILKKLSKVSSYLQNYCMSAEGWFKSPKFHFKFDDRLEHQNHMDTLFEKINEELRQK